MISICIPIFNCDVSALVGELIAQSKSLTEQIEIVLIDDDSASEYQNRNRGLDSIGSYIQLSKNIGRSAIRNRFLEATQYKYLLFLDCDTVIIRDDFLSTYLSCLKKEKIDIICGGREYQNLPPPKKQLLRWNYGKQKESKSCSQRARRPYRSFLSNNFIIERTCLESNLFNEELLGYGHEDTLFGFQLKKNQFNIVHIDNPVQAGHLDENGTYLTKSEEAVSNLVRAYHLVGDKRGFIDHVTLLYVFNNIRILRWPIRFIFYLIQPALLFLLKKGNSPLWLFDFYKLGLLESKMTL